MSQWGARTRDRKRQRSSDHTFDNIKERVKQKTARLKKQKIEESKRLQEEIDDLYNANSGLKGRSNIHKFRDNIRRIDTLESQLKFITDDKPYEEFVERITPILTTDSGGDTSDTVKKQQRHIVFLNLFHKEHYAPCFIEKERCEACNMEYVMVESESVLTCPTCGESDKLVSCNSDFIEKRNSQTDNPYERGPMYRKYIMQFHKDAPNPPKEVMAVIYKHLSKVHIMLSIKVKPTPIAQILRQEKLQKWVPYAVRITKLINQEPIVSLTQELIDRLVFRFNRITQVFAVTKVENRKKIMNFEFLTKQFLQMEGLMKLAEWFQCHKTRDVLKEADTRLFRCSQKLENTDDLNWQITRSC